MNSPSLHEQEIIALLESQRDVPIEYPRELLEKRRNSFLSGITALGLVAITWAFLGFKGILKLSSTAQLVLKLLLVGTVASGVVATTYVVVQNTGLGNLLQQEPTDSPVQLRPFTGAVITPQPTLSPYPTPSLAPSITPETTSTAVARLTPLVGTTASGGNGGGSFDPLTPTPTDDKPGNSYGLTKTPVPGEPNSQPNGSKGGENDGQGNTNKE